MVQFHISPFTLTQDFNSLLLVVNLGVVSNMVAPLDELIVAVCNGTIVVHIELGPKVKVVVKSHHTCVEPFKDTNHKL